jgi:hypothetical protein
VGDLLKTDRARIVFIGGTGRCGTSITKEILATHPLVGSLPFEYRFIIDPDGIVDFYRTYAATWSPYLADKRIKRLASLLSTLAEEPPLHRFLGNLIHLLSSDGRCLTPRRYHGWNLNAHLPNFKHHVLGLLGDLTDFTFRARWVGTGSYSFRPSIWHAPAKSEEELARILGGFVRRTIRDYLESIGRICYVEDNTWNILFARELVELIPEAKILHVIRDPRDVVASLIQQTWSPSDVQKAALWYRSLMTYWLAIRPDLPPDCYHEFNLETLVSSTEQVLREVCHFLDMPYDVALLKVDLSKSHTGRWRQELTQDEQHLVQGILADLLAQLGYS